jgi:hypothetical protein
MAKTAEQTAAAEAEALRLALAVRRSKNTGDAIVAAVSDFASRAGPAADEAAEDMRAFAAGLEPLIAELYVNAAAGAGVPEQSLRLLEDATAARLAGHAVAFLRESADEITAIILAVVRGGAAVALAAA